MKRITVALLVILLLCLCGAAAADDAEKVYTLGKWPDPAYRYTLREDDSAKIVDIQNTDKFTEDFAIPAELDGHPVTAIGDLAFEYAGAVSFTIPASVTEVGVNPFKSCSNLVNIFVEEGNPALESIDGVLFSKADKRLVSYPKGRKSDDYPSYNVPEGTQIIGALAFWQCQSMKEITLPDSLISIEREAFYSTWFNTIVFPEGLKSLGDDAFYYSSLRDTVQLPDSLTEIGNNPFRYCNRMKVALNDTHPTLAIVNEALVEPAANRMIFLPRNTNQSPYVVPSFIETFDVGAMMGCDKLVEVVLPETLTEIAPELFKSCSQLVQVNIPQPVRTIGDSAFYSCRKLSEILLPDGLAEIGNNAFYGCSALTAVDVPASVKRLGEDAFQGCEALVSVTLREGLESIGTYAFWNCKALPQITIPASVSEMGRHVFWRCTSLTSFDWPQQLTTIPAGTFSGCTALAQINIPDTVTAIKYEAFRECASLTEITLPPQLTSIENMMVSGCASLVSITVPEGVKNIDYKAFSACPALQSVVLPATVTRIASDVFTDTENVTVYVEKDSFSESYCVDKGLAYSYGVPEKGQPQGVPAADPLTEWLKNRLHLN